MVKGRKGEFVDMIELLRSDGYARALIDGEMTQLSDDIKLTKQKKHTIEVVVDRLVVKDGIRQRLTDSVETALKLANGSIIIDFVDEEEGSRSAASRSPNTAAARTGTRSNSTRSSRAPSPSTPPTVPAPPAPVSASNWKSTRTSSSPTRTGHWPTASSNRGAAPR